MARQAQFNFEPVHILVDMKKQSKLQKHVAALHVATGQLRISPSFIRDHALNGAFIKLYADVPKKVIGFKVFKEGDLSELNGFHQLKSKKYTPKNGKYATEICTVSCVPLVKLLGLTEKSYTKMPIQKYSSSMFEGDIYYVELKKA